MTLTVVPIAIAFALSALALSCSSHLFLLILLISFSFLISFTMVSPILIIYKILRASSHTLFSFGSLGAPGKIAILENLLGSPELRMYSCPSPYTTCMPKKKPHNKHNLSQLTRGEAVP